MDFVGFPWLCNFGAPEMLFGLAGLSDTSLHPGANVTAGRYCPPLLVFAHQGEVAFPGWPGFVELLMLPTRPGQLSMDPGSSANFQPWI